jgi:hypothetical protein
MALNESLGNEGVWRVSTHDSHYLIDMDVGDVQRFAGPVSNASPIDVPRCIRDIHRCAVGARGYWTMWPTPGDPDYPYRWKETSVVRSITRKADDGSG